MRKTLSIQIPKPCHENWNTMTPNEKGRHCQVCDKTVSDFTGKTDEQIITSFENNGNLCGRFKETQLNRELVFSRKEKNNYLSYVASGLFAFLALQPQNIRAQGEVYTIQTDTSSNPKLKGKIATSILQSRTIQGTVIDENGLPLPTATVHIEGTNFGASTDFDGHFSIKIKSGDTLSISYVGYYNKKISVKENQMEYHISLEPNNTLDQVVVTAGYYTYNYAVKGKQNRRKSLKREKRKEHREQIHNGEIERSKIGQFIFNITNAFLKKKE